MAVCVFTPRAEADLADIWVEIASDSIDVADQMLNRIRARCESRAAFPHSGERHDDLIPHLRRFMVEPYLVFYFPVGDGISLVRVLHGRRDIDRLFSDEG